ncbi:MAG: M20/M25/M40 family metallo-hydrolase [Chloroflexi bacterium]|nr:M20/M25/M40 family metallo-hydrolase [Chloroflexota bacterium]
MTDFAAIDKYIVDHLDDSMAELSRLCAQPSVSAQGLGIRECSELVAEMLKRRGFAVEIIATNGHPVVYGEAAGDSDRALLFYNHYDVQPPEPLELWDSPPFQPTLRDGKLFARGVSDDKGHIQCRLSALDAVKAVTGSYPCRIKFVIEGEEETSSLNLEAFVKDHAAKLKADGCVWEFGGVDHEGRPTQYLGLRGICYVELSVKTGTLDAHSGLGGSIFPNAAWRLVWALNTLKDGNERIRIPGFYDAVKPPSARDLELLAALPDNSDDLLKRYGLKGFLKGMPGGPELRREEVFVPTCTICGLTSGYQGPGSKTALPAQASAKVDFRLVPDQEPLDILRKLRAHLEAEGFSDVEVNYLGGEAPGRTDPDHPFVKLVLDSAREAYRVEPVVHPMIGGSGPNHVFLQALNVPIVTAGVGYPGSQAHAPNENMVIDHFVTGTKHTARIVGRMKEEE